MAILKNLVRKAYENMFYDEINARNLELESKNTEITNLKKDISNLKSDIDRLRIIKPIEYPKILGTISISDIYATLRKVCSNIYISDISLNLTTQEEASRFSKETQVSYAKYITEDHDCDNFSFALLGYWSEGLKSYAFGMAWTKLHAFNIMIDENKQIWIVEPQTNKYTKVEEMKDSKYSPITLIII